MSRACKKVILPSGPTITSVRAVSGISKSDKFRTSPAPSVSRSCHRARLREGLTERDRFVPEGATKGLGKAWFSAALAKQPAQKPRSRHADHKQFRFMVESEVPIDDSGIRQRSGNSCGAKFRTAGSNTPTDAWLKT